MSQVQGLLGDTYTFGYHANGQLTSTGYPGITETYAYDLDGRRVRRMLGSLSGAKALARKWGTSFNVRVRGDLGADGASSAMIREVDGSGGTVSMTHRVVSPDGNILHQHRLM
jgi:hypothetical protein